MLAGCVYLILKAIRGISFTFGEMALASAAASVTMALCNSQSTHGPRVYRVVWLQTQHEYYSWTQARRLRVAPKGGGEQDLLGGAYATTVRDEHIVDGLELQQEAQQPVWAETLPHTAVSKGIVVSVENALVSATSERNDFQSAATTYEAQDKNMRTKALPLAICVG
jgi:hypothetical protein